MGPVWFTASVKSVFSYPFNQESETCSHRVGLIIGLGRITVGINHVIAALILLKGAGSCKSSGCEHPHRQTAGNCILESHLVSLGWQDSSIVK